MSEKQALIDFDLMALKLSKKYCFCNEFEDLYQIARIAIVEAIRTFDSNRGTKLSTYVFIMILSKLKNYNTYNLRSNTFNQVNEDDCVNFTAPDFVNSVNLKIDLENFLNTLTENQKMIIKMRYVYGYSLQEISKIMNCSHQNVSKLNSKALKLLSNNFNNSF